MILSLLEHMLAKHRARTYVNGYTNQSRATKKAIAAEFLQQKPRTTTEVIDMLAETPLLVAKQTQAKWDRSITRLEHIGHVLVRVFNVVAGFVIVSTTLAKQPATRFEPFVRVISFVLGLYIFFWALNHQTERHQLNAGIRAAMHGW